MLVTRDDREAGDPMFAHRLEDLGVLAVITAVDEAIALAGPFRQPARQVPQVGAPRERAEAVAPDFPWRLALAELIDEPCALLAAEVGLARIVFLRVRDVLVAEAQRRGRLAAVVGAAVVDHAGGVLVDELREGVRGE